MSKVKRKAFIIIAVLAIVMFVVYWGNTALEVNQYTVRSCKVPESFEGFCIAQISDLHNAQMGKNNEKLLQVLQKQNRI